MSLCRLHPCRNTIEKSESRLDQMETTPCPLNTVTPLRTCHYGRIRSQMVIVLPATPACVIVKVVIVNHILCTTFAGRQAPAHFLRLGRARTHSPQSDHLSLQYPLCWKQDQPCLMLMRLMHIPSPCPQHHSTTFTNPTLLIRHDLGDPLSLPIDRLMTTRWHVKGMLASNDKPS